MASISIICRHSPFTEPVKYDCVMQRNTAVSESPGHATKTTRRDALCALTGSAGEVLRNCPFGNFCSHSPSRPTDGVVPKGYLTLIPPPTPGPSCLPALKRKLTNHLQAYFQVFSPLYIVNSSLLSPQRKDRSRQRCVQLIGFLLIQTVTAESYIA